MHYLPGFTTLSVQDADTEQRDGPPGVCPCTIVRDHKQVSKFTRPAERRLCVNAARRTTGARRPSDWSHGRHLGMLYRCLATPGKHVGQRIRPAKPSCRQRGVSPNVLRLAWCKPALRLGDMAVAGSSSCSLNRGDPCKTPRVGKRPQRFLYQTNDVIYFLMFL